MYTDITSLSRETYGNEHNQVQWLESKCATRTRSTPSMSSRRSLSGNGLKICMPLQIVSWRWIKGVNHHRYPVLDGSLPRPADQDLMPTVNPVENSHGQYRRQQPKRSDLMYLHLRSPFSLIRDILTPRLPTSVLFEHVVQYS
jgi:hypothetical protein